MSNPCDFCYQEVVCTGACDKLEKEKKKRKEGEIMHYYQPGERHRQAQRVSREMKAAYHDNDKEAARKIMKEANQ